MWICRTCGNRSFNADSNARVTAEVCVTLDEDGELECVNDLEWDNDDVVLVGSLSNIECDECGENEIDFSADGTEGYGDDDEPEPNTRCWE